MYKSKMSGFKLSVVMILAITILCSITFGTLAYFRVQTTASGTIIIGSNINFAFCNSSGTTVSSTVQFTNFSEQTNNIGIYVKKTAGVDAKLRAYVAVSIEDSNGNLQNLLNESGNAIVTVTMGTGSGYSWVSAGSTAEQKVGAGWRYLKTTDGSSDYKINSDAVIPVCASITVNDNDYADKGYKIIVSITAEMLQFDNASWA